MKRSGSNSKKTIVLSGINLFEGGPLSVYYDFLDALIVAGYHTSNRIIAFVHKRILFKKYENFIELVELPKSRKSYIYRLYYEFIYFKRFSDREDIDIWISLHDITPRVKAKKIYTYCHNVSPFIEKNLQNLKYSPTNVMFSYLYKYIYRLNIKSATSIIVQTNWMRNAFLEMYPIKNVIVARPDVKVDYISGIKNNTNSKKKFLFPAFPRYFKNFEIICEAAKDIEEEKAEIILTLNGTENKYSKEIVKKYCGIKAIKWIGIQPRNRIYQLYNEVDCLIFPSKMETWGLPISEFKQTGKDMIIIDLPYAKETLGHYEKVMFFKPNDSKDLNEKIKSVIEGKQNYSENRDVVITEPYVSGWKDLIELIIS